MLKNLFDVLYESGEITPRTVNDVLNRRAFGTGKELYWDTSFNDFCETIGFPPTADNKRALAWYLGWSGHNDVDPDKWLMAKMREILRT